MANANWGLHDRRVAWLRQHLDQTAGAPGLGDDVDVAGRACLEVLVGLLRDQGLFPRTTSAELRREQTRRALTKARQPV